MLDISSMAPLFSPLTLLHYCLNTSLFSSLPFTPPHHAFLLVACLPLSPLPFPFPIFLLSFSASSISPSLLSSLYFPPPSLPTYSHFPLPPFLSSYYYLSLSPLISFSFFLFPLSLRSFPFTHSLFLLLLLSFFPHCVFSFFSHFIPYLTSPPTICLLRPTYSSLQYTTEHFIKCSLSVTIL